MSLPPAPAALRFDAVGAYSRWSVVITAWELDECELRRRGLGGSLKDYHALALELFDETKHCTVEEHQHVLLFRGRSRVAAGRYPLEVIIEPVTYQHCEPWRGAWGLDGFTDFDIQDAVMYAAAATAFYSGVRVRPESSTVNTS